MGTKRFALAALLGLVLAAAMPAAAQATTAQEGAKNVEVPEDAFVTGFSTDIVFEAGSMKIQCSKSELLGNVTANGGKEVVYTLFSALFYGEEEGDPCKTDGLLGAKAHVETANFPWTLTTQQPDEKGILIHLKAEAGELQFKAKVQLFGLPASNCIYKAPSLQFTSGFGTSIIKATGTEQLKLDPSSTGECPGPGTVQGEFAISTEDTPILIDMT